MMRIVVLLLLSITFVYGRIGYQHLKAFRGHGAHISNGDESGTELYFENAIVDHYTSVGKYTYWKQRYFINDEFWKGEGYPVFLYIGGEGPISSSAISARNYIYGAAKKHSAMLIAVEHRYYGKSYPTKDMSLENMVYLTSSQALFDLGRIHGYLSTTYGLESSKWIAFGGSYPGNLAAWFKLKFPKLVVGSIASSAPILAKRDFHEYMEVVGKGYRYFGGGECYHQIEKAVNSVQLLLHKIPNGRNTIQKLFHPCSEMQNDLDDSVFEASIMGFFQDITQYNMLKENAMTVQQVCDLFTRKNGNSALQHLVDFVNQVKTTKCLDAKFDGKVNSSVSALSYTEFDGQQSSRQWFYQTCNEFGYFQSAESPRSPFHAFTSVTIQNTATELCKRVFNINVDPDVYSTNIDYGALGITVENVTFPSGTIDPWHALAVQNNTKLATSTIMPVYIEGTAHCADMRSPKASDSPHMQRAHAMIDHSIQKYLSHPNSIWDQIFHDLTDSE